MTIKVIAQHGADEFEKQFKGMSRFAEKLTEEMKNGKLDPEKILGKVLYELQEQTGLQKVNISYEGDNGPSELLIEENKKGDPSQGYKYTYDGKNPKIDVQKNDKKKNKLYVSLPDVTIDPAAQYLENIAEIVKNNPFNNSLGYYLIAELLMSKCR